MTIRIPRYAAKTDVPIKTTKAEIEGTFTRHGITEFGVVQSAGRGIGSVQFVYQGRIIRMEVHLPDPADRAFTHDKTGRRKPTASATAAYDQAVRQRWRGLLLRIKAKLEAVADDPTLLDAEFLAYLLLPGNTTVGEQIAPQLQDWRETGTMPRLLAGLPDQRQLPEGRHHA